MPNLPPGWATELAVLEHSGATVEDRGDHLLIRSPLNPDNHWGHSLFVTDRDAVGDVDRWLKTFQSAFPEATWVAIGLSHMPDDQDAWFAQGLDLGLDDVLTTRTLPRETPVPKGYAVRRLSGEDWSQSMARRVAENERSGEHEPRSFERFTQGQTQARRTLSERDLGGSFGAFADEVLIADLDIVQCGTTARYQNVSTGREYRQQGLTSHLLGVAARWSANRGCDRWVIVSGASNAAGRVYRSLGFEPDTGNAQAYRRPDHGDPH